MPPPTRRATHQVCGGKTIGTVEPSLALTVRRKGKFDPTGYGRKPDDPFVFFDTKAAGIIAHHASLPMRSRDFLAFVRQGEGRNAAPLSPSRVQKLPAVVSKKTKGSKSAYALRKLVYVMQRDTVLLMLLPAQPRDNVAARTGCRQRRIQDRVLVRRQLKLNAHCARHTSWAWRKPSVCKQRHFAPPRLLSSQALEHPGWSIQRGAFRRLAPDPQPVPGRNPSAVAYGFLGHAHILRKRLARGRRQESRASAVVRSRQHSI
jgi:hypothetical protein